MTSTHQVTSRRILSLAIAALSAVAATVIFAIVHSVRVEAATAPVPLGTASGFAVLAGSGITNTGPTVINGDIGTFPTTDIAGASEITLTGTNHAGDDVTKGAKDDLRNAYNIAAAALPPTAVPEELGRIAPYGPGIYKGSSSLQLTGAMTLDARGDPSAVFIFQAPTSTLTTASNSSVLLLNGAQACNIFWQVGSSATIGTGTTFRGNILAHTSISANTNATVKGRLLASNGAVTLDSNTITRPRCEISPTTGSPTTGTPTTDMPGPTNVTPSPTPGETAATDRAPDPTFLVTTAMSRQMTAATGPATPGLTATCPILAAPICFSYWAG
ncbi:MAG: ice-binding family protein [Nocardioidaceae bacterium]